MSVVEGADEGKAVHVQLQSITNILEAFRPLLAAREQVGQADPLPEQKGFLAYTDQPQRPGTRRYRYEAMLLCMGWHYVVSVGSPDEVFEVSPDAFDLTMQ